MPATLAVGPHQEKHWAKCDEKKGPKRVEKMLVDVAHGSGKHWTRKPYRPKKAAECGRRTEGWAITLLTKLNDTRKYFPSLPHPYRSMPQRKGSRKFSSDDFLERKGDMRGWGEYPTHRSRHQPYLR